MSKPLPQLVDSLARAYASGKPIYNQQQKKDVLVLAGATASCGSYPPVLEAWEVLKKGGYIVETGDKDQEVVDRMPKELQDATGKEKAGVREEGTVFVIQPLILDHENSPNCQAVVHYKLLLFALAQDHVVGCAVPLAPVEIAAHTIFWILANNSRETGKNTKKTLMEQSENEIDELELGEAQFDELMKRLSDLGLLDGTLEAVNGEQIYGMPEKCFAHPLYGQKKKRKSDPAGALSPRQEKNRRSVRSVGENQKDSSGSA